MREVTLGDESDGGDAMGLVTVIVADGGVLTGVMLDSVNVLGDGNNISFDKLVECTLLMTL